MQEERRHRTADNRQRLVVGRLDRRVFMAKSFRNEMNRGIVKRVGQGARMGLKAGAVKRVGLKGGGIE